MSTTTDDPGYQFAIAAEPDTVYVQLPPVDAVTGGAARDAMRRLFRQRGFTDVGGEEADDPTTVATVANGCALVREDDERAVLVVTISERTGVTRIPVPHGDLAWSRRVFDDGQVLVVLTQDAVDAGAVTPEGLRRDADEGGVSVALVPAGEL